MREGGEKDTWERTLDIFIPQLDFNATFIQMQARK